MSDAIDKKDEEILEALKSDSRQSTADISRKTGIPRMTIHQRIERMKARGIIERFTVKPNYGKLGQPTTAFILLAYSPGDRVKQSKLAEKIAKIPGVYEVFIIAGEWDMLLKARGASIEAIGKTVVEKIRELEGVDNTFTMASFATVSENI